MNDATAGSAPAVSHLNANGISPIVGPENHRTCLQEGKIIQNAEVDQLKRNFPCALSRRGFRSRPPRDNQRPEAVAALRIPCFRSDAVRAMDQLQAWL